MIWIPLALLGAALQTVRNGLQRSLIGEAGPWGATLVRFLFGLPFSLAWLALLTFADVETGPGAIGPAVWGACAVGAGAQLLATAAVLLSMRASTFAVGTTFMQSQLIFAAVGGLWIGDGLSSAAWAGVVVASAGLAVLSWRGGMSAPGSLRAAGYGLAAGLLFGLSGNAFRVAIQALAPQSPVLAAATTLSVVQAMQSGALVAWMGVWDRPNLFAALRAWRRSLGAGFFGAAASAAWFSALAFAPAAHVRAVGVAEIPFAAIWGGRLLRETLSPRQILGALLTLSGVLICSLAV